MRWGGRTLLTRSSSDLELSVGASQVLDRYGTSTTRPKALRSSR
jgi:hypothetical protein